MRLPYRLNPLKAALLLTSALLCGQVLAAPAAVVNGDTIDEADVAIIQRTQIATGECRPDSSVAYCTRDASLKRLIRMVIDRQHLNTLLKTPTAINQLPEFASLSRLLTTDDAYWYAATLIPPTKIVATEAQIAELYAQNVKENEAKRRYSVQRAVFGSKALAEQFHKRLSANPERFREDSNPLQTAAMRPQFESDRVTVQLMQDYDPAFAKAVLALKTGEFTAPVKTVGGWEVIKLGSLSPEPLPPLAEIHDKLKARLENRDKSRSYDPFEAVRKTAAIKLAPKPGQPLVDVKWPELGQKPDSGCGCDAD